RHQKPLFVAQRLSQQVANLFGHQAPVLEKSGQGVGIEHITSTATRSTGSHYLSLSPAFAFALREYFVEHRRLAWSRLQEAHDLVEPLFGHWGQHQPTPLFAPGGPGALSKAQLLAQFRGNYHLSLGTDDGAIRCHGLILPQSKTCIICLTNLFSICPYLAESPSFARLGSWDTCP